MMHHLWTYPLLLLSFCRTMPMCFRMSYHRVFLPFAALSTRSISSQAVSFPTTPRTIPIPMKQRRFSAKSKRYLIRATFVSLSAIARFLFYLFQRRMVPDTCVLIITRLTISQFVIAILYLTLMICLMSLAVLLFSPRLICVAGTTRLE
jgi:hypothetical protein